MLNHLSQHHLEHITLWYVIQHSVSSFYKLITYFQTPEQALRKDNQPLWQKLGIHRNHLIRLQQLYSRSTQQLLEQMITSIQQHCDFILTQEDPYYPKQLLPFENRPPIIFGQGNLQALLQPQIALVGSRKASQYGRQITYDFADYLSKKGFYITSGLAQGIDSAAHHGALNHQRTIAVMGTGIDQTYPEQNSNLRAKILQHHGTIITEFLPNSPALQAHFPRRNRLVSGLSLGVIVTEASIKSGSLITAKWAAEQGRSVFVVPGHIYHDLSRGCHQLIRDGAILVDHPEQVIEDLALATQWHHQDAASSCLHRPFNIPEHLMAVYSQLDWVGQNLDQLMILLDIDIATLTAQLIELELLGLCMQQSGLYLRCRSHQ